MATTFGITHVKDGHGKEEVLYLHCLDIDSDNVLRLTSDLLEELQSKTFVTKTKKDCRYHVYWLSHTQNPSIGVNKCKRDYEFEIKTDNSLGLCSLPPSQHRDDPYFRYQCVGRENKIALDYGLYDKLLQLLSKDCLISNDDDDNNDEGKNTREDASRANRRSRSETAYKDLTDTDL